MSATTTTFSAPRVTPQLAHAFGGIWRLTFRRLLQPGHWLAIGIGLAVLTLLCFAGSHEKKPDEFIHWAAAFYVTFLVPALAFVAAGGAMRDEMKAGTVDYVLTRPVPRPAFVVFKYIAHTLCLQIDLLFALGVVLGFAAAHQTPDLILIALKLLLGQLLLATAFSALGFLCGVITTRYIILGLFYLGVVEVGVGQIPTQLSRLSMTRQVRDLLAILFHRVEPHVNSPGIFDTTGILLAFAAVTLALAVMLFSLREFAGAGEN